MIPASHLNRFAQQNRGDPLLYRRMQTVLSQINPQLPIRDHHHLKFLWHPAQLNTFLRGGTYAVTPITVELDPSLDCNLRCPHCTYFSYKERTKTLKGQRIMGFPKMQTLLAQLAQAEVKGVIFTGGGEPLINPATHQGIREAKRLGLSVGLFTNGILLGKEIMEAEPDFVRISLNAVSWEKYGAFHGTRDRTALEKAKENTRTFALRLSKSQVVVGFGISTIVNEKNVSDLPRIARFIGSVVERGGKIDYFSIRPVVNYQDYQNQLPPELIEKALTYAGLVREILLGSGVLVFVAEDYFYDLLSSAPKSYEICLGNPWAASIGYDGGFYLCSERKGQDSYWLGDLSQTSFQSIWQGERRKSVIEQISNCPPRCKLHRLNKVLDQLGTESFTQKQLEKFEQFLAILRQAGTPAGVNFL